MQKLNSVNSANDEMSLSEFLLMFYEGRKLMLASVLISAISVAGYIFMAQEEYEATLVVKIGRVHMQEGPQQQIEKSIDTIARILDVEFQSKVIDRLGWKSDVQTQLVKNSLRAWVVNDRHIKIELRGFSPDDARNAINACVSVLTEMHEEVKERLITPILKQKKQQLSYIKSEINESKIFISEIKKLIYRNNNQIQPDTDWLVIGDWLRLIKEEKTRLQRLYLQKNNLEETGEFDFYIPTAAASPAVVSDGPVHPKIRRVWFFGLVGGVFLGGFLIAFRALGRLTRNTSSPSSAKQ